MSSRSPLGDRSAYQASYSPDLLHAIPRDENRRLLGLTAELPFHGEDVWNAYELAWLDSDGKPRVAMAEIRVPADSPNIIESKSMKLYLISLSMTRYTEADDVRTTIANDLARFAGAAVSVLLIPLSDSAGLSELPGVCIDDNVVNCESMSVDPNLLACTGDGTVSEELQSHLLRSLCPVTDQPDTGSLLIRYKGRQIDPGSLLRYIVSFRNHNDFHESCVERLFLNIKKQCEPEALTVYARYNRRGGIDINPFRSDFEPVAENLRLWRQ